VQFNTLRPLCRGIDLHRNYGHPPMLSKVPPWIRSKDI